MSQDDFEAALTSPPETAADDITTAEPSPNAGPRTMRSMTDGTRKLFQTIVEKHKGAPGEPLEVDELVPVGQEPPVAAAVAATGESVKPAAIPQAAAAAPTSQPDLGQAIIQQQKLEADMRDKAYVEREAKLAEREKALPSRERYLEKPAEMLRDLIKEYSGAANDSEMRDAIIDAITDLTHEVLGAPVDPGIKREVEARKALRAVKSYKTDIAKGQEKLAADRVTAEAQQREHHAIGAIAFALNQEPTKYPHLMAEDNPELSVWRAIKFKHEKEGVELRWEEAAALADKFYSDQESAKSAKRTRLLNPAASNAANAKAAVTQGVGPQNRQAPTTQQKPVEATEATLNSEPVDEDTRRRRSLGKVMSRLKESSP